MQPAPLLPSAACDLLALADPATKSETTAMAETKAMWVPFMLQAARRRTSQIVAPMRSRESASSQPPSMNWNDQNRLAG